MDLNEKIKELYEEEEVNDLTNILSFALEFQVMHSGAQTAFVDVYSGDETYENLTSVDRDSIVDFLGAIPYNLEEHTEFAKFYEALANKPEMETDEMETDEMETSEE